MEKSQIISLLEKFIGQRPGLEYANYGDAASYRYDYSRILKHKHDAERMLRFVEIRESITAEDIAKELQSGRLTLKGEKLEYVTGQYFPTEYRAAVCRVLVTIIWDYFRSCGYDTGDKIRKQCKREFGVSIGRRWFD